jgi:DNA replication protein DnaC
MEAVKLAECLPSTRNSVKPSKRNRDICERCKQEVERKYLCRLDDKWVRACDTCAPIINAEQKKVIAGRTAKKLIPPLFQEARLEHLSGALQDKIRNLPADKGLLFWGEPGVGKSYAMAALMRYLLFENCEVKRISYEMLCLQLRDTYKPGSTKTELDVIEPLVAAEKLFIEDVGTTVSTGQQESDFSLRTFLVLLDQRLENCRPTFITTNKSIEEFGKSFDQRIASRLQQACEIVHLTGEDRRTSK